ncbi:MAG: hypothetical protein U0361_20765 [Nitrospiraceae bacterium]
MEREALRQGLTPGHFSFNAPGGRCERCEGNGYEKLEMYFFEDIYAICEECNGRRFKPNVLGIHYRGKTIHDVLNMTVSEALGFFSGISPKLTKKTPSLVIDRTRLCQLLIGHHPLQEAKHSGSRSPAELKDPVSTGSSPHGRTDHRPPWTISANARPP